MRLAHPRRPSRPRGRSALRRRSPAPAAVAVAALLLAAACGRASPGIFLPPRPTTPLLTLSTTAVAFAATVGSAAPAAQAVTVSNAGGGVLPAPSATVSYPAGAPSGWLAAAVTGSAAPYGVTLAPTVAGLAAGTYAATVTVSSAGVNGSPQEVAVTLDLTAPGAGTRTVTVTRIDTYWYEDGTTAPVTPNDLAGLSALPAGGGAALPAVAVAGTPGSWTIAGVPSGTYTLRLDYAAGGSSFVQTAASSVDLGRDFGGDFGTLPTASTVATFDWSNLLSWNQATDSIELYACDAGVYDLLGGSLLPAGATSARSLAYDWNGDPAGFGYPQPLLVATDTLHVVQLRAGPVGSSGDVASTAVAQGSLTGAAMASATPITLPPVTLAPPTSLATLNVTWQTSLFEAALPAPPAGTAGSHQLFVVAHPSSLATLWFVPEPIALWNRATGLVLLGASLTAPAADRAWGTVSWHRFLPSTWLEALTADYSTDATRTAPGATTGWAFADEVFATGPTPTGTVFLAPVVSMVQTPLIAGRGALSPLTSVGTTPGIRWSAPATGAPTSYRVQIFDLSVALGTTSTSATFVAELITTGTSVSVPAGLLAAGKTYVAQIVAREAPDDRPADAPYRIGASDGEAILWTGTFSP